MISIFEEQRNENKEDMESELQGGNYKAYGNHFESEKSHFSNI